MTGVWWVDHRPSGDGLARPCRAEDHPGVTIAQLYAEARAPEGLVLLEVPPETPPGPEGRRRA